MWFARHCTPEVFQAFYEEYSRPVESMRWHGITITLSARVITPWQFANAWVGFSARTPHRVHRRNDKIHLRSPFGRNAKKGPEPPGGQ